MACWLDEATAKRCIRRQRSCRILGRWKRLLSSKSWFIKNLWCLSLSRSLSLSLSLSLNYSLALTHTYTRVIHARGRQDLTPAPLHSCRDARATSLSSRFPRQMSTQYRDLWPPRALLVDLHPFYLKYSAAPLCLSI